MALRLDIDVVRGEIDNRVRGKVRGRVWLAGCAEPLLLELAGNPWRDLAGCRLEFENPKPQAVPHRPAISPDQTGTAGDITASRKVRVPDLPVEEFSRQCKAGKKPPAHWANALYLEWFSHTTGRVVIESAEYNLKLSMPEWRMTEVEEREQKVANGKAMTAFLARLTDRIEKNRQAARDGDDAELDEFGWEKTLRASDTVGEKYAELLDKYGDDPEAEDIIHREMGWHRDEEELTPEQTAWRQEMAEIMEAAMASVEQENKDETWKQGGEAGDAISDHEHHPLVRRATDAAMTLWRWCKDHGLMDGNNADEDVAEMTFRGQMLSAKLAGALNGTARNLPMLDGFVVAALKRALPILDAALAATQRVGAKAPPLVPAANLDTYRHELFAIREEMLRLMDEFRHRE
ncbi:MAG: hypothetical protein WC708_03175 [Lentisphaeria bacterium]